MKNFCPVSLDLRKKKCLIVGGGQVAFRKVKTLLLCQARVLVVSPVISSGLRSLAESGMIEHLSEPYNPSHLEGVFLVVSSTNDEDTNRLVAGDCFSRNILINTVDNPSLCNFFFPSLVDRGLLSIAISTEGKSPALARLLKEKLEEIFDEDYGNFIEFLGNLRPRIMREVPGLQERKSIFRELAGDDFFNLYRTLPAKELEKKVAEIIARYRVGRLDEN